jgi:SAM-dependent methyltransferase
MVESVRQNTIRHSEVVIVLTADQYPTVEQDWPRMYTEFSDVYDRFAEREWSRSRVFSTIDDIVGLDDKVVADVGAGTGRSSLEFARYARLVIGIEPSRTMWRLAVKNVEREGAKNVTLLQGSVDNLPLARGSVDVAACVMSVELVAMQRARKRVEAIARAVRSGGFIVIVGLPPLWYGGELAAIVLGESRTTPEDGEGRQASVLARLGFKHRDVDATQRFESVHEAASTYGFIFGRKAIRHLIGHNVTSIRWKFRISYRQV